ncbi:MULTISPECIES: branched-chain amino acid ABC transporter substrate-binding protein [unclassified Achromobacter]|uniref:branched-chain amino acid ABC transporter substrate-binding protein n=1 Tax=unclassified Achromobacter TaxID=2626865 RepID=UPI000B515190|nr:MULTISPECIES: branched-chain amino acid ABC transporter substrate-binding protein [unclassified Achromobacter]OWT80308.1 branched-chain amino acid ABC transporter substrate-binding protein [Achromobacter sp. HZ34]OWT82191.1 branched-chain amino acid ABC transporter substrate-binding protein [Achromobacter sp. HZ28]
MKKRHLSAVAATAAITATTVLGALPAAAAPVKIGLVETLSGPQASTGQAYRAAVRYTIDQINAAGGWNGEPVQLLEYDNQGGPAGAADKLKAAAADGVSIVVQGASSAIGGQITEDVRKYNLRNPGKEMVYINMGAEALELTGDKCSFYHFRFAGNAQVRTKALIEGMKKANALGAKVYAINQNYSWGQDMEQATVDFQKQGGYTVVEKTLHDVNKIQDFAPYVAKIAASGADTVITGNWSNDLLLLMKASKAAGLKAHYGTVYLDQPGNIANAGDLALGNFVAHTFNAEANGAEGEQFIDDYKAKTGHIPVFIEPQTVYGMKMVAEALKHTPAKNGALNVNEFAKVLETTRIPTPMGEMSMRGADHQAQLPIVVSTVTRDAKFKVDGTDMGFKPVLLLSAEQASTPVQATCKMKRPG